MGRQLAAAAKKNVKMAIGCILEIVIGDGVVRRKTVSVGGGEEGKKELWLVFVRDE